MKTQELLEALTTVKPGLSNKEIIEQSTNFAFFGDKIVTYNDEISISYPMPDLGIEGSVKAEELYKFLNKVKAEEIDITQKEDKIYLKAGRSKVTLTTKEIKLDLSEVQGKRKWKKIPEDLMSAVEFVAFAASKDSSIPILSCAHVKDGYVEATDRYRIVKHDTTENSEFFLPLDVLPVLKKVQPTKICIQDQWIHFKNEQNVVVSTRTITGDYPDTSEFFIKEGKELVLPKKTKEIVDRACVFPMAEFEYDKQLTVIIDTKGKLTIKAESEYAKFEESTKMSYKDAKIKFKIVATAFQEILEKDDFTLLFGEDKLQFEGPDWSYVTPITLFSEDEEDNLPF